MARAQSGFLLLSVLLVLAMLLALVSLSLTMTHGLWRASQAELAHSELVNAQRAAYNEVTALVQAQRIAPPCWHVSPKPWLAIAAFEAKPQLGCYLHLATAEHFYWLEQLTPGAEASEPKPQQLIGYQLHIITRLAGQSWEGEYYEFVRRDPSTEKCA